MKFAIIDLDGVVADSTERFKKAEEARQATWNDRSVQIGERERTATNTFWQTAFTPELVNLDVKIEGVNDAIDWLLKGNYTVFFLTSRPETMRLRTEEWLHNHRIVPIWGHNRLIMKAPAFQYTKTVPWKVGMVQTLVSLYGASHVLFVDDEQVHRDAVMNAFLDSALEQVIVAGSLADALEKLQEEK